MAETFWSTVYNDILPAALKVYGTAQHIKELVKSAQGHAYFKPFSVVNEEKANLLNQEFEERIKKKEKPKDFVSKICLKEVPEYINLFTYLKKMKAEKYTNSPGARSFIQSTLQGMEAKKDFKETFTSENINKFSKLATYHYLVPDYVKNKVEREGVINVMNNVDQLSEDNELGERILKRALPYPLEKDNVYEWDEENKKLRFPLLQNLTVHLNNRREEERAFIIEYDELRAKASAEVSRKISQKINDKAVNHIYSDLKHSQTIKFLKKAPTTPEEVDYYKQTTNHTCGPVSLINSLELKDSQLEELTDKIADKWNLKLKGKNALQKLENIKQQKYDKKYLLPSEIQSFMDAGITEIIDFPEIKVEKDEHEENMVKLEDGSVIYEKHPVITLDQNIPQRENTIKEWMDKGYPVIYGEPQHFIAVVKHEDDLFRIDPLKPRKKKFKPKTDYSFHIILSKNRFKYKEPTEVKPAKKKIKLKKPKVPKNKDYYTQLNKKIEKLKPLEENQKDDSDIVAARFNLKLQKYKELKDDLKDDSRLNDKKRNNLFKKAKEKFKEFFSQPPTDLEKIDLESYKEVYEYFAGQDFEIETQNYSKTPKAQEAMKKSDGLSEEESKTPKKSEPSDAEEKKPAKTPKKKSNTPEEKKPTQTPEPEPEPTQQEPESKPTKEQPKQPSESYENRLSPEYTAEKLKEFYFNKLESLNTYYDTKRERGNWKSEKPAEERDADIDVTQPYPTFIKNHINHELGEDMNEERVNQFLQLATYKYLFQPQTYKEFKDITSSSGEFGTYCLRKTNKRPKDFSKIIEKISELHKKPGKAGETLQKKILQYSFPRGWRELPRRTGIKQEDIYLFLRNHRELDWTYYYGELELKILPEVVFSFLKETDEKLEEKFKDKYENDLKELNKKGRISSWKLDKHYTDLKDVKIGELVKFEIPESVKEDMKRYLDRFRMMRYSENYSDFFPNSMTRSPGGSKFASMFGSDNIPDEDSDNQVSFSDMSRFAYFLARAVDEDANEKQIDGIKKKIQEFLPSTTNEEDKKRWDNFRLIKLKDEHYLQRLPKNK